MYEESLSELANLRRGRYLLVNVVMRRSRDLYAGAKPLVKTPDDSDAGTVAYEELMSDRLKVVPRKAPSKVVDLAKQDL